MRSLLANLCFVFALAACAPLSKHDAVSGDGSTKPDSQEQEQGEVKRQEQYDAWFQSLTPEQRAHEILKQHERALVP